MYKFKVKDTEFTIPKSSLLLLALQKAIEVGYDKPLKTNEQAIIFFKEKFGIEMEEINA